MAKSCHTFPILSTNLNGINIMKTITKILVVTAIAASMAACTSNEMTTSQRNAAIGAVVGGATGNLIGGDTGATLGGAALGGMIGSQIK